VKEHVSASSARQEEPREQDSSAAKVGMVELQQSAGNAAVTGLIQRQDGSGGLQNRPNLLGGQQLHLDPQLEAEMRRIELQAQLDEILHPRRLQLAVQQLPFQPTAQPQWLPPSTGVKPPVSTPPAPSDKEPEAAHAGDAGDLVKAIMAVPEIDGALTNLKTQAGERVQRDWSRLSTGERVLVITTGVTIAGSALGGAMANADSRNFLLQQVSGRDFPVPGIEGLSFQVNTQKENMGVMFTFDVGKHLPASWGFH
jgi:hypothetical protein